MRDCLAIPWIPHWISQKWTCDKLKTLIPWVSVVGEVWAVPTQPVNELPFGTGIQFVSSLCSEPGWTGVVGEAPSTDQVSLALEERDLYMWVHHGIWFWVDGAERSWHYIIWGGNTVKARGNSLPDGCRQICLARMGAGSFVQSHPGRKDCHKTYKCPEPLPFDPV